MDSLSNNDYFSSYEDLEVHKLMLKDMPRNEAYRKAILGNAAYFKDKVVMDVGCGTGILSIFCAQAGARKVYAVEASNLSSLAKDIVKENGFENVIEVIQSKVEDVILEDNAKVDAIVSEWMGFYLLHEGMLDSVIVARDKFLKDDGQMFPNSAAVFVSPCSVPSLYSDWEQISGVSMTGFAKHLRGVKSKKPEIMQLKPEDILGAEVIMAWINLREDKVTDLDAFSIQHVVGSSKTAMYQGLCVWFECHFPDLASDREENRVTLGTGPSDPLTHWKQTVIVLPEDIEVEEGEPIAFKLDLNRDVDNSRRYNLQVQLLDPEAIDHPMPCSCHMTKCILVRAFMQEHPTGDEINGLQDEEIDSD